MKKFLKDLISVVLKELVADLKEEYLEKVVYDYYFVKYKVKNAFHTIMIKVENKGEITYELEKKIIIKHNLDPENLNIKIESIFKL